MDKQLFDLKGKVALITGGSKGIGKAIAYLYGLAGAKVVVSSRKAAAVEEVAFEFKQKGIEAVGIPCHMGETSQIEQLVQRTHDLFGTIDIVVNNAATNPVFGPLAMTDTNAFDKIMNVNVKGPYHLCKVAYPLMKAQNGGSIINISSVEGLTPGIGLGLYSVSKSALIMLTKVMAREWGKDGIRANVICPGLIQTKFSEALWKNEVVLDEILSKQPIGEMGQPEDIAGIALLLASEAGKFCTGSVMTADGGLTI